ncbi:MAG TPA: DUF899 family protein [Bryobacteraceae bacterium]|jgi:predicted dithiol-disulfide oxidoreductase (DUF899 family)|nr:DUF899 family protein [Bryobacteraceae bacterium]
MTKHTTGTRETWLAARLKLHKAEKELTRRSDELAQRRQELPWVRIDKEYRFVYHTYSTYARRDGLWGMYQWLDRAPKGRNETGVWWRRHDE